MNDKYANFSQLAKHEKIDIDYTLLYRECDSELAVIAPHGGGIEPGTVDIADVLAGCDYTFYAFKALKKSGNRFLHITSNRFDEPLALKVSRTARVSITIHGSKYSHPVVHIGGRHHELKQSMKAALINAGFDARISEIPGLRGLKPENICNRCISGQGVQLEISRGLREQLFKNLVHRRLRQKTVVFYQFVRALNIALTR